MKRSSWGFLAAILVGLTLAVALLPFVRSRELSIASLERELGPKRYSEEQEELLIRHFFKDRKFGVFVDVGAGHYLRGSNTYYLEKALEWRGIAIDANDEYGADYTLHRPNTQFISAFVSDRSDAEADFFLAPNARTRSSGFTQALEGAGRLVPMKVKTATLNDLLRANSINRFDFMSMDIELGEPRALAGLDIRAFRPKLICIEAHEPVRDQIAAYFAQHGYRKIDEFLRVDRRNWYYTPH